MNETNYNINWYEKSREPGLSEEFIRKNANKLDWSYISAYQKLSEDFIREFQDKVDWNYAPKFQKLSENFIREFIDKIYWYDILIRQVLSEDFIREFRYEVNWYLISKYQKLSENFIREFIDKVDWYSIPKYQKLSKEFLEEFDLEVRENCWFYKSPEWKEQYIRENTDYPIEDGMITAYKSTTKDGYSVFTFRYKYEVGKEYTSHADSNIDNSNSFGLSAWTKAGALNYHRYGKLFKVGIKPENLACVVQDGGKLRATKIKILEDINWY